MPKKSQELFIVCPGAAHAVVYVLTLRARRTSVVAYSMSHQPTRLGLPKKKLNYTHNQGRHYLDFVKVIYIERFLI